MKNFLPILFLSCGLLTTSVISAQPTLTQSGTAFAAGDVISISTYYGHYISPGSPGMNQTWDLTALPDSGSGSSHVVAASSLAIGDSFPGSTIAMVTGGSNYFYSVSSTVMQNTGTATDTTVAFAYVNPEDILRFPFTYSNAYSDPWRAISYANSQTRIFNGTTTVTADGYGSVQTPNQTYPSALRVHFIENYYDSLYLGFWFVHVWKLDAYRWYVDGIHNPVAEIDSSSLYYLGVLQGTSYGGNYLNSVTGIKQVASLHSFSVSPNPTSDYLNLDIPSASSGNMEVKIFNAVGAEMEVPVIRETIPGNNSRRLDVRHLPQGIYFARITTEGVLTTTRFVVTR